MIPRIRQATAKDLAFIEHLQRTFSNQLGFLPRAALEEYITRQSVTLAEQNDQPSGYILGLEAMRYDRRIRPITQAAICMDAQRRRQGLALVSHIAAIALLDGQQIVQCWCANDIEAMEFWPAAGFKAVAIRSPHNARGRNLTLWRKAIGSSEPYGFWTPPPLAGHKSERTSRYTLMSYRKH